MATTSISRRSRLAGLLSKAGAIRGPGALNAASRRDLQRVLQADYVRSLRKLLRYEQVSALVDRAAGVWPDFNKRPLRVANIKRLRAMLEALGISLRAGQLSGDQSDKLAGFYLSEN